MTEQKEAEDKKPVSDQLEPDEKAELEEAFKPSDNDDSSDDIHDPIDDKRVQAGDNLVADNNDQETPYDDAGTAAAIRDIVSKEGDQLLADQDSTASLGGVETARRHGLVWRWWHSKLARWMTLLVFVAAAVTLGSIPNYRYSVLNTAGARASTSVQIVDRSTELPLKGVLVSVDGKQVKTDSKGMARLNGLRLGKTNLKIQQAGFAIIDRSITIGWGSNPLGEVSLKPVGIQYTIEVRDYLSDQALEGVEATNGDIAALSSKTGKITLTLEDTTDARVPVTVSLAGYRTESAQLNADEPNRPIKLALVPAKKVVFVSKQNGNYDVYKSDLDGQNSQVILPATGHETSNIWLVVSPDNKRAALVSTRDNKRDAGGSLLNTLVLINTDNGETLTIAESPQIQMIDWIGNRLIFQQVGSDATASNNYTVTSYDYSDNSRLQLASAKDLGFVFSAMGKIYYAVSADPEDVKSQVGLFRIDPDSSNRKRVYDQEVWSLMRSSYDMLTLQNSAGEWATYSLKDQKVTVVDSLTAISSYQYFDNPSGTVSVKVSQGAIAFYDTAKSKETIVNVSSGSTHPLQWYGDDLVVYRVATTGETADYAVSVRGSKGFKISDVAVSHGFSLTQ